MTNLLYKEFKLAMHPTVVIFMGLSAMMLIPNYPYYVTFFYTTLGLFFLCLTGRENNDIDYTALLPVPKEDIVKARVGFSVIVELIQFALAVPFAFIRHSFNMPGSQVGMDANVAFFGLSFVLVGIFNFYFFTRYYKNPSKVGFTFGVSSIIFFTLMVILEAMAHMIPFFRDVLDTPDPMFIKEKILVLLVGLLIFIFLTLITLKKSIKSFVALDL